MSAKLLAAFLNYNTSSEIEEALQSLPAAGEGVAFDLLVLDNASTKAGEKEKLRSLLPEKNLLFFQENLGFAGAFNKVLPPKLQGYDYVLLLNSDLLLPKGFFKKLLDAAEKLPDLGLAGVALEREDGSAQFSFGPEPTLWSELTNRSLAQKRYVARHKEKQKPFQVENILGAVMLVNTAAVEKIGPMDPRFFFFFEETEWCARMRDYGFGVYHFPFLKAVHLQGRAANKTPLRARIEFHRSRRIFFRLRHGVSAMYFLTAGLFLRLIINACSMGLLFLLTLGKERFKEKAKLYFGLLSWYLKGCPESGGLKKA